MIFMRKPVKLKGKKPKPSEHQSSICNRAKHLKSLGVPPRCNQSQHDTESRNLTQLNPNIERQNR